MSHQEMESMNELLSMTSFQLEEYVAQALENNPVLEADEHFTPRDEDIIPGDRPLSPYGRNVAANPTLRDVLMLQLMTTEKTVLLPVAEYIIGCLDRKGYLKRSIEELADETGLSREQVEQTVQVLQGFDPAGVCAGNLQECLLLQLRRREDCMPLSIRIVKDFLEPLARGELEQIAEDTGSTVAEVRQALKEIRTLNPKPGSNYSSPQPVVLPDVKADLWEGSLRVSVVSGPRLAINHYYLERLDLVDQLTREYLDREIEEGRQLIGRLQRRWEILSQVARWLVAGQQEFLFHGKELRPLTAADGAAALGLEEKTVRLAAEGKYLQYSKGSISLTSLFKDR